MSLAAAGRGSPGMPGGVPGGARRADCANDSLIRVTDLLTTGHPASETPLINRQSARPLIHVDDAGITWDWDSRNER